jgi:hypothetical protein
MNKKAQSTIEACVVVIIVTAACLAMQGYLKRTIQGNWKSNADSFSDGQYERGVTTSSAPSLAFIGPRINAQVGNSATGAYGNGGNLNVATGSIDGNVQLSMFSDKIFWINSWGTYYDQAEPGSGDDDIW